jgi:hypothetical protein
MADSDVTVVSHFLRLILQALFESLDACGLPGDRLKQEMFKHIQQRREEAIARGESEEMYSLAQGAVAVDPEMEDLLMQCSRSTAHLTKSSHSWRTSSTKSGRIVWSAICRNHRLIMGAL